eukprot:11435453-Alexandrium_andersonii.AAC.1
MQARERAWPKWAELWGDLPPRLACSGWAGWPLVSLSGRTFWGTEPKEGHELFEWAEPTEG